MRKNLKNIYLNLPFCSKKCIYCDYPTCTIDPNKNFIYKENKYIFFLQKEIEIFKKNYKEQISDKIETIYIGGGTPSIIDPKNIENLIKNFEINNKTEITIEVEPEDINKELLENYKKIGINRISLGIQTFHISSLKFLKRNSEKNKIQKSLNLLLDYFASENINIDLLIGIPKESFEIYKKNLEKIISLNIGHITLNILSVEEKTKLKNLSKKNKIIRNNTYLKKIYNFSQDYLKENNYKQYDIISFTKKNKSKHNSIYMKGDKNYLAFGLGASSLINNIRFKRPHNLKNYYKFVNNFFDNPDLIFFKGEDEFFLLKDILKILFISNLMKIEGLGFNKIFFYFEKFEVLNQYEGFISDLKKLSEDENIYLEIENDFFRLKEKEILNLDYILEEIFEIIDNL